MKGEWTEPETSKVSDIIDFNIKIKNALSGDSTDPVIEVNFANGTWGKVDRSTFLTNWSSMSIDDRNVVKDFISLFAGLIDVPGIVITGSFG
jgi:hypothetical protein